MRTIPTNFRCPTHTPAAQPRDGDAATQSAETATCTYRTVRIIPGVRTAATPESSLSQTELGMVHHTAGPNSGGGPATIHVHVHVVYVPLCYVPCHVTLYVSGETRCLWKAPGSPSSPRRDWPCHSLEARCGVSCFLVAGFLRSFGSLTYKNTFKKKQKNYQH